MRRTKILCTLGPTSNDEETLEALIRAGMNAARLNFSHGDHEGHRRTFALVRKVSAKLKQPVAILQDLQGPKIRVGELTNGELMLERGSEVVLVAGLDAEPGRIPCSYEAIAEDVAVGDPILLDDGRLGLEVLAVEDRCVRCRVDVGGLLTDHKGINLPGVALSTPALTEKDRHDLELGLELGVDYVALSFVRSAEDVKAAKALCGEIPLIAKIEKPEAIDCIDAILEHTDGVMVARGDLGVEMGPERVPMLQKMLIEKANARGQLVITATEMLDSMRHSPRPTRAEASDVANAVLDGTDAVMLSGETAKGDYPVESVRTMHRIVCATEESARYRKQAQPSSLHLRQTSAAVARAAVVAAAEIDARAILCHMERDTIAMIVSEYRPEVPLAACTRRETLYWRLALHWGVIPLLLPSSPRTTDEAMALIVGAAKQAKLVEDGDQVVVVAGRRLLGESDALQVLRV
ncbi:MAG: pyruvate kinase [Deltaproteobacteria bacterium]|nr:pyruvate kinase [Deltaproteobacteria bacterium]